MPREIKILHLEPTDVCQAACPACVRETDSQFDRFAQHHLTIDQILKHVSDSDIAHLSKMFMCGNYGDPAAGKHTLDIFRYFRSVNPEIVLGMNTNGALQNKGWWQTVGELFHRAEDYVVFSIDGLEDTNHIYRRGVNWHRLIENIKAYISTGASAHWDMLVYRHNEHQVDACQEMAASMGFVWFRAKVSKRPLYNNLQMPVTWEAPKIRHADIRCHVLNEKSVYIDAQGRQSPCCWLGARQVDFVRDLEQVRLSWQSDNPNPTCLTACGTSRGQSNFGAQWRREVALC